jgi:hypothetical protein
MRWSDGSTRGGRIGRPASGEAAPDYAEPILGWRAWDVVDRGGSVSLRSLFFPVIWPPYEPLQANCRRPSLLGALRRQRSRHGAPHAGCECGIYACELDLLGHYLAEPSFGASAVERVAGRVSLWDDVVECDHGWRGARAYPAAIFISTCSLARRSRCDPRRLVAALEGYGVPVCLLEAGSREEFVQALACEPLSIGGER